MRERKKIRGEEREREQQRKRGETEGGGEKKLVGGNRRKRATLVRGCTAVLCFRGHRGSVVCRTECGVKLVVTAFS